MCLISLPSLDSFSSGEARSRAVQRHSGKHLTCQPSKSKLVNGLLVANATRLEQGADRDALIKELHRVKTDCS